MFAADTPAQWRGPVKMDEEERELLESIGRGASSGSKIAEAENDDIVAADDTLGPLIDKDLPPLSLGQLTSVHQIRGMLLMAIVQPLFPAQPFGALQTVYFARCTKFLQSLLNSFFWFLVLPENFSTEETLFVRVT